MNKKELIGIVIFLVFSLAIIVYSANEEPAEFGDDTITTAWIGGHSGVLNVTGKVWLGNFSVNISTIGDLNATTVYASAFYANGILLTTSGDLSDIIAGIIGNVSLLEANDTAQYQNITLMNTSLGQKADRSEVIVQAKLDEVIAGLLGNVTNLEANDTAQYQNITLMNTSLGQKADRSEVVTQSKIDEVIAGMASNITRTEGSIFNNLSAVRSEIATNITVINNNLTQLWINISTMNDSLHTEWINPENIVDVDDEDIESDLNTYVDIAGDIMTGPLVINGDLNISQILNVSQRIVIGDFKVNISSAGDVNATKFYGDFIYDSWSVKANISSLNKTLGQKIDRGEAVSFDDSDLIVAITNNITLVRTSIELNITKVRAEIDSNVSTLFVNGTDISAIKINASSILSSGGANITGAVNITGGLVNITNLTVDNSAWSIYYNGTCLIMAVGTTEGRICG